MQRVAEFLREQSASHEEKLITQLIIAFESLARQPRLGQREELPGKEGEIRTLLVAKKHRLVYEIPNEELVMVLQVLDLRQNNTLYQ